MRAVYRLLGLVRRYGNAPVDTACSRALDLDVVSVTKIASMLEKATEDTIPLLPTGAVAGGRFARQPAEFATRRTTLPATKPTTTAGGPVALLTLIRGGQPVAAYHATELPQEDPR